MTTTADDLIAAPPTIATRILQLLDAHTPLSRNDLFDYLAADYYPADKWTRTRALDAISSQLCILKNAGKVARSPDPDQPGRLLWTSAAKAARCAVEPDRAEGAATCAEPPAAEAQTVMTECGADLTPADPKRATCYFSDNTPTVHPGISAQWRERPAPTPPDPVGEAMARAADLPDAAAPCVLELSLAVSLPNNATVAFEYSGPANPEQLEALRSAGLSILLPARQAA